MTVLNIFDIDDTLFQTKAQPKIKTETGVIKSLNAGEFIDYKLKPGESFDFSEYTDSKLFYDTSIPNQDIWQIAQSAILESLENSLSRTVIVTARSDLDDKDIFLETFTKHGMAIENVHVFRAGNLQNGSTPERKKIIIRNLLVNQQYTTVSLYDDQIDNLTAFLSLKNEFQSISFYAFLVENGSVVSTIIA